MVFIFLTMQTPFAAQQYVSEINLTVSAKPIHKDNEKCKYINVLILANS